ncbi:MAG: hypothetical protein HIU90_08980 [Proteobacteria bacterium]|nr:hypothetical protein [Pseudomonadota bacterium]
MENLAWALSVLGMGLGDFYTEAQITPLEYKNFLSGNASPSVILKIYSAIHAIIARALKKVAALSLIPSLRSRHGIAEYAAAAQHFREPPHQGQ